MKKSAKKRNGLVFQQYSSGALLGGVKTVLQSTMWYFTALNFLILAWLSIKDTSFSEVLRDFVARYVPWFNFPVFLAISVAVLLVMMWVEFKFIIPSSWEFANWQWYEHSNPMREELRKMAEGDARIERRLGRIEKRLGIKSGKEKPR